MPKGAKSAGSGGKKEDAAGLRKSLLSTGVDEKSAEKLLSSRSLERVVVPVYWKDGLTLQAHPLWLSKLPNFLKSFQKEFPEGQVRWDPDYDEQTPQGESSRVAIRVYFDYQEDDQGHHWSPKPTEMEEQSYQRMLKRFSYVGKGALQASAILHGE
ncbi:MAG: hypothetical protein OK454_02145 [Thaumarchaeota archaeon]|nr:hypothetical protein [Nitrososphaerota archaeon]